MKNSGTIKNSDASLQSDNPLNGKIVYNFFCPDDKVEIKGSKYNMYNVSIADNRHMVIRDYTSLLGQMKSIAFYSNEEKLVKKNKFTYQLSEEAYTTWGKDGLTGPTPLGMVAQKHRFYRQYDISHTEDDKFTVTHLKNNIYQVESISQIDNVVRNSEVIIFDSYNGLPRETEVTQVVPEDNETPDFPKVLNHKHTSAYWEYEGLESKNMLTQPYQIKSSSNGLVSSSVNRWSNNVGKDPSQWYTNETWLWKGDEANPENNTSTFSEDNGQWVKTKYIKEFDNNGRVLEMYNGEDVPVSKIYGYGNSKVVAVAQNAKTHEIHYMGFEPDEPNKMGDWESERAAVTKNESYIGSYCAWCIPRPNMASKVFKKIYLADIELTQGSSKRYLFQAAVKASGLGNSRMGIECLIDDGEPATEDPQFAPPVYMDISSSSEWQIKSLKTPDLSSVTLPANAYFKVWCGSEIEWAHLYVDDLRFYPNDALMTSYAYDCLTGQLIGASDENGRRKTFKYDALGRLIERRNTNDEVVSDAEYYLMNNKIKVISPVKDGEYCEIIPIKWLGVGSYQVKFSYSIDNGVTWNEIETENDVITPMSGIGEYNWEKTEGLFSDECFIKVEYVSHPEDWSGISEKFTMIRGVIHIVIPKPDWKYTYGRKLNITWTTEGVVDNVEIKYLDIDEGIWRTIVSSIPSGDGNYYWNVPFLRTLKHNMIQIKDISHPQTIAEEKFYTKKPFVLLELLGL